MPGGARTGAGRGGAAAPAAGGGRMPADAGLGAAGEPVGGETRRMLALAAAGAVVAAVPPRGDAADLAGAARAAYWTMLLAAQALVGVRGGPRAPRVAAATHAAFWERCARPEAGVVAPALHRWLLEAYALCGR